MNANELADAMEIRASIRRQATSRKSVKEGANDRLADQLEQAAIMIREQQALIEALKYEKSSGVYDIEPVAWMVENDEDVSFIMCGKGFAKPDESWNKVMPVYTHPVKELTDEEIWGIASEYFVGKSEFVYGFARAILRKAQE